MQTSLSVHLPISGLVFAIGSPMGLLRRITGMGGNTKENAGSALVFSGITLTRDYWTFVAKFQLTNLQAKGPAVNVTQVFADVLDQKNHTVKTTKLFLGAPVGHLERQKDTCELRAEVSTADLVTAARTIAPGQTEEFSARLHIPDDKILLVQFGVSWQSTGGHQTQRTHASTCHVLGSPFEMWADEDTYSVPQAGSFLNAPLEIQSQQEFNALTLTDIAGKPAH
jgi:hypothetical protein